MKTREERIAFDMNYCQHYGHGSGADMVCTAGCDIKTVRCVPTGKSGIKWGPCIEGHLLDNPLQHCPKWVRRTREHAEARAVSMEKAIHRLTVVMPVVKKWRSPKPYENKNGVITCPVCGGKLHLSQSAYNGHVWGKCETDHCVGWME